jgi:Uma2 family endonuclease
MPTLTADVRCAVDHLPPAAVLTLDGITWEEYEQISEDLEDRPSIRVTYDQGTLDIVTNSHAHGKREYFVGLLVWVLSEELGPDVEGIGHTTEKRKRDLKGTEPDGSFYVGNLERTIGKEELNLETDAPPDIVVEIDKSSQSLRKFPIYATFGVPEIWRYLVRRKEAQIFALRDGAYVEIPASRFFPILTGAVLARFIEQSSTHGQTAALAAFRRWVKKNK